MKKPAKASKPSRPSSVTSRRSVASKKALPTAKPAHKAPAGKATPAAKRIPVSKAAPAAKPAPTSAPPPAAKRAVTAKPAKSAPKTKTAGRPSRSAATASPHHGGQASALMALHEGIIYGPVRSRRLGRSLGINLTPAYLKLCSFNCSYCQYGWSDQSKRAASPALEHWPAPAAVGKAVASALKALAAKHDRIDRLTLAGHGEPTMHPRFKEVVSAIRKVRDDLAPGVPITILSNASQLHRDDVRAALSEIDERYMKLDAGDTATLRSVNGTVVPIDQILDGLSRVPDIIVQAMFVKDRTGRIDNTGDLTVITWIGALERVKPKAVHMYTIDRTPAFPYLQQVPAARLREIAQRVRLAGLRCDVFGIQEEAGDAPAEKAGRL